MFHILHRPTLPRSNTYNIKTLSKEIAPLTPFSPMKCSIFQWWANSVSPARHSLFQWWTKPLSPVSLSLLQGWTKPLSPVRHSLFQGWTKSLSPVRHSLFQRWTKFIKPQSLALSFPNLTFQCKTLAYIKKTSKLVPSLQTLTGDKCVFNQNVQIELPNKRRN